MRFGNVQIPDFCLVHEHYIAQTTRETELPIVHSLPNQMPQQGASVAKDKTLGGVRRWRSSHSRL